MNIQAIILLGGQGTRLRQLFPSLPKALVPVLNRPFIEHQLRWLQRGGIRDVHLAAGYRADAISAWLSSRSCAIDMHITISHESRPLGTGGALKFTEPNLRTDPFIVLNGDSMVPRFNFQTLENFKTIFPNIGKSAVPLPEAAATWRAYLVIAPIEESGRYGTVEVSPDGRVLAFCEKTERKAGWVNAGVYLLPRCALELIVANRQVSLEHEIFPMLAEHKRLYAIKAEPPLLDMGTPDGLCQMEDWLAAHPF